MTAKPFSQLSAAEQAMMTEVGRQVVVERFLRLDGRGMGVKGPKKLLPLHPDASEAEKMWHAMCVANEAEAEARREARLS